MKDKRQRDLKRKRELRRRLKRQGSQRRDTMVGYVARQGINMVCDGDACVVAGSHDAMISIIQLGGQQPQRYAIEKAFAEHILQAIELGGAYAFDEEAYGRFLPIAQDAGLALTDEDFSDPGPLGIHFVRIGYL